MLSPSRITLENNGKIRPQPDRENAFARASGGAGGIRTHGGLAPTAVFKTAALNHSATAPSVMHERERIHDDLVGNQGGADGDFVFRGLSRSKCRAAARWLSRICPPTMAKVVASTAASSPKPIAAKKSGNASVGMAK